MSKNLKQKRNSSKRQTNQYDKIFRENVEAVLPLLIEKVLGIVAVQSEEIPDDIQRTVERRSDVLKIITDNKGRRFILHIEIQTADDLNMDARMLEYYGLLYRIYRLPIKQYVIYLGEPETQMVYSINDEDRLHYNYKLISFKDIDYRFFTESDQPEIIVFAILANQNLSGNEKVVDEIVNKIKKTTKGELDQRKFFEQLRIIVGLRNFGEILETMLSNLSIHFDETKDHFYRKGSEKGFEKGIEKGIEKGAEIERIKQRKELEQKVIEAHQKGYSIELIADIFKLNKTEIREIIDQSVI